MGCLRAAYMCLNIRGIPYKELLLHAFVCFLYQLRDVQAAIVDCAVFLHRQYVFQSVFQSVFQERSGNESCIFKTGLVEQLVLFKHEQEASVRF